MNDYVDILNNMVWSFSSLSMYKCGTSGCPYAFYQKYIEKVRGISNFYAENGTIMHDILERIIKKELDVNDAPREYMDRFYDITVETKQKIMDSTYDKCIDYLCTLDYDVISGYEILGVEKHIEFKVGDYNFQGYIDLLIRNKDGEIIVVDHKSGKYPFSKKGDVLASEVDELEKHKKQLYLYSKAIHDEYNTYPKYLAWNHFKDGGKIAKITFNHKEYENTLKWALDTIDEIKNDMTFSENKNWFYCNNLCNYREMCYALDEDYSNFDVL